MSRRVAIIASQPGLETAFKVMNIAMAAVASDAEVAIFLPLKAYRSFIVKACTNCNLVPVRNFSKSA